jgi:hypothetical protein
MAVSAAARSGIKTELVSRRYGDHDGNKRRHCQNARQTRNLRDSSPGNRRDRGPVPDTSSGIFPGLEEAYDRSPWNRSWLPRLLERTPVRMVTIDASTDTSRIYAADRILHQTSRELDRLPQKFRPTYFRIWKTVLLADRVLGRPRHRPPDSHGPLHTRLSSFSSCLPAIRTRATVAITEFRLAFP